MLHWILYCALWPEIVRLFIIIRGTQKTFRLVVLSPGTVHLFTCRRKKLRNNLAETAPHTCRPKKHRNLPKFLLVALEPRTGHHFTCNTGILIRKLSSKCRLMAPHSPENVFHFTCTSEKLIVRKTWPKRRCSTCRPEKLKRTLPERTIQIRFSWNLGMFLFSCEPRLRRSRFRQSVKSRSLMRAWKAEV